MVTVPGRVRRPPARSARRRLAGDHRADTVGDVRPSVRRNHRARCWSGSVSRSMNSPGSAGAADQAEGRWIVLLTSVSWSMATRTGGATRPCSRSRGSSASIARPLASTSHTSGTGEASTSVKLNHDAGRDGAAIAATSRRRSPDRCSSITSIPAEVMSPCKHSTTSTGTNVGGIVPAAGRGEAFDRGPLVNAAATPGATQVGSETREAGSRGMMRRYLSYQYGDDTTAATRATFNSPGTHQSRLLTDRLTSTSRVYGAKASERLVRLIRMLWIRDCCCPSNRV
ncbi:hypothetical protein A3Q40_00895 [Rhodococcus sp. PBTS 1]|nr:hypothetical protein A3Q40_00895 [Rhodococcus sp. PBTS 1]